MTPRQNLGLAKRPHLLANEIHLPELHLPEITREGIARSLSEVRIPDLGRSSADLAQAVSNVEWPTIDLPSVDLGRAIAGAAAAAHIGRRSRRPRWPLALVGLVVAGLAGWGILSQDAQRARLTRGARAIRERISMIRSDLQGRSKVNPGHAIAFSAAATAPIDTFPLTDGPTLEVTDDPAGPGSNSSDGTPAIKQVRSPA